MRHPPSLQEPQAHPQDSLHPYGIFLFSPWIPGNFQEQIFIVSPDLIILF